MKKCNGTGLVLKICETKNNVWKKHELSILNGIDNYIEITKIKLDSAIKRFDSFEFTNPGILKLPLEDIYRGGNSKSRNPHMQTMLRLVGFGDNAGSGFPTILDVWKSEGWIKPELIEDTNLDQVTLVMKMEKESDDNSAEKSAESAEKSADSKNESNRFIRKAEADFSLYGCWG
ncbi:ATP-binding protein [Roseburia intestinalis]|uniref:ATP-binding protein n=1 Tax=Roseburia intestinalis TaxID=166486 RepID=UPI001FAB3056|nr:ATP-binding protein [Roseburia intestinalis]